jgi:hypothetical protein
VFSANGRCNGSGMRAIGIVSGRPSRFKGGGVSYVADSPGDGAFFCGGGALVGLTFDACREDDV